MNERYFSTPAEALRAAAIMTALGFPPQGFGVWAPAKPYPNPPADPVDIALEPAGEKRLYVLAYDGTWPQVSELLRTAARQDVSIEQRAFMLAQAARGPITLDEFRQAMLAQRSVFDNYQAGVAAALGAR